MKREIKFRGRDITTGDFVYGDLVHGNDTPIIRYDGKLWTHVDPDSVAQLVGRDRDGNEFYDGDKFFDSKGDEYIASLESMKRRTTLGFYEFWSGRLKLKEA